MCIRDSSKNATNANANDNVDLGAVMFFVQHLYEKPNSSITSSSTTMTKNFFPLVAADKRLAVQGQIQSLGKKTLFPLLCNFVDTINKIESTGAVFAGREQETFDKVRNEYLPC